MPFSSSCSLTDPEIADLLTIPAPTSLPDTASSFTGQVIIVICGNFFFLKMTNLELV